MSGGVDSSVAALLMKEQGYECVGATMHLIGRKDDPDTRAAAEICRALGMEHHVLDFSAEFREKVIRRFVCTYERGETPNPCIDCNRHLKFARLYDSAKALGCEVVATGHYAQIACKDGVFSLKKAVDEDKDQSYVLYTLGREQLTHTVFPLGSMTKKEIRLLAAEHGFGNADKADSQDICFVPDGNYADVISAYSGKTYPKGNFVTRDGRVLGEHKGIIHYTVGQRKGLGLSLPEPMYVCRKNVAENEVVLGKNEDLFSREFDVSDVNWIVPIPESAPIRAKVKVRYKQKEQPATILPAGDGAHIIFDEPQRAIAIGQAAVFYDEDTVLGGGTIQRIGEESYGTGIGTVSDR